MPNSHREEILAQQKLVVETWLPSGPDVRVYSFFAPLQAILVVYLLVKSWQLHAPLYALLWFAYKVTFTGFYNIDRITKVVVRRFNLCRKPKPGNSAPATAVSAKSDALEEGPAASNAAFVEPLSNDVPSPARAKFAKDGRKGSSMINNNTRRAYETLDMEDGNNDNGASGSSRITPHPVFKLLTEPRYYTHQIGCCLPLLNLTTRFLFFARYQLVPNLMLLNVLGGRAMYHKEKLAEQRMSGGWFKMYCLGALADLCLTWFVWLAVGVIMKFQLADRELAYSIYKVLWILVSALIAHMCVCAALFMLNATMELNPFGPFLCLYFEPWTLALTTIILMDFCSACLPTLICCEEYHDEKLKDKELELRSSQCMLR